MFLYRNILKKSLAITWGHKYLWFFGIFAALLGGIDSYSMSFSRMPENWNTSIFSALAIFFNGAAAGGNFFHNIIFLFKQDPFSATILATFILIIILVSLFLLWLAVVSQIGLINNSAKVIISDGKKDWITIKEGLAVGIKKFWQILGFNLINVSLVCFFAVLIGLPLIFLTPQSGLGIYLLYIFLFVFLTPVALIVSFLFKYAICFSVIKEYKFVDSFVEACRLFGKYWLVSIEMALILFIIDFLAVVAVGMAFLILAIPYIFAARILSLSIFMAVGTDSFFQLALMLGMLLSLIFVVLAGAVITCFKTVAWTDLFISLVDKKGGLSKIARLAASLKK